MPKPFVIAPERTPDQRGSAVAHLLRPTSACFFLEKWSFKGAALASPPAGFPAQMTPAEFRLIRQIFAAPNSSLERISTGKPLGPRAASGDYPPRGSRAFPAGPLSSNIRLRMHQPRLFEASVPVLVRFLGSVDRILVAVELLAPDRAARVLVSRLAADMLPFAKQVETAAYFALRTAYPLAGRQVPPFVPSETSLPGLRSRVADTLALVRALGPEEFIHAEERRIPEQAGEVQIELPAARFLAEFALPNFFFHLNMAYAIARSQGCTLGKAEYDGFHVYKREA